MSARHSISLSLAVLLLFPPLAPFLVAQHDHETRVWNYDGGLQMMTDGQIPSGPCFSINGHVTAPEYFENLKRVDTKTGASIHRGKYMVTEFPDTVHLSFLLYDLPCTDEIEGDVRTSLTDALVSTLRVSCYWKRGVEMRPANAVISKHFKTHRLTPHAKGLVTQLSGRLGWEFELDLPSAGVPVTDSLVIILRTPDGHIAARAAARM